MDTCWYCGEEIEFRYIDGRCVPMHISGNLCEGYSGDSASTIITSVEDISNEINKSERHWRAWQTGHACSDLCIPLTYPTICPICEAEIFFHTNGNGDVVFFDDLGWPWPKHECLSTDSGIQEASNSANVHTTQLRKIAELGVAPSSLQFSRDKKIMEFDSQKVERKILGVVMRFKKKKGYKHIPDSYQKERIEILSVALQVASEYIRIFLPGSSCIEAGQILEMYLEDILIDGRHVLFAKHYKVILPPEEKNLNDTETPTN